MEAEKAQRLYDALSKLAPRGKVGGLGYQSSVVSGRKHDPTLPQNPLYSNFVRAGTYHKRTFVDVDDESNSDENLEASEKHKSKKGKSEKKDKKDKKVKKEKKDKNSKKNKNKEGAMDTVAPNVEVAVTPVTVPIQTEEEAPKLKKPKKNKSKEVEVIEPVTLTATLKEDTITKSKKSKKNKSQGDQPATMTDSDPATDLEVQANTAVSIYRTNTSKSVIADTDDVSLDKEHKRPKKNKDKK